MTEALVRYPDPRPAGSLARGLDALSGRVLDFGCATGRAGRYLRERGCQMYGVESNADAARVAAEVYERVWTRELTDEGTWTALAEAAPFDAVLWLDVLEHLPQPERMLSQSLQLLKPGGLALLSIPNVAHWSVRARLLAGRWNYTDTGILDRTHVRFFTRRTVRKLVADAGLTTIWERGSDASVPIVLKSPSIDRLLAQVWPPLLSVQFVILARRE